MAAINQFLIALTREERSSLYITFGNMIYPAMILLFIYSVFVNRVTVKKVTAIFASIAVSYYFCTIITAWMNLMTNELIPDRNLGVAFLPYVAVFSLLLLLFGVPILEGLDVAVPVYVGGRGVAIIGCIFEGCCHGSFASWGIFSEDAGFNTVPCPVIDITGSIMIALLFMRCSRNKGVSGKTAAYGMVAFGVLRYIIDVLRDNQKMHDLITFEGIFGFVYLCIGLAIFYVIDKSIQQR